jgi:hypothetical protein
MLLHAVLQALALCVNRWWAAPESSPWSYAPILHSFQVGWVRVRVRARVRWWAVLGARVWGGVVRDGGRCVGRMFGVVVMV